MQKVDIKFGPWIEQGFNLYKEHIGILILASLLVVLLSALTAGILAGPMVVGLVLIVLAYLDGKEPAPGAGEVFAGLNYFLNAFLFYLVWGVVAIVVCFVLNLIPCVGQLAAPVVILAITTLVMFGPFLIADKQMDFWPASMASIEKVKTNFWPMLGFAVIVSILGSLGGIVCGIGMIVTLPLMYCVLAVAYREVFADTESAPAEEVPAAPASEDASA